MTNDDPPASVAPMPGVVSDREIMRQAIEGLRDDIAAMKRSQQPPTNGHISRGQIVNLVLGALLTGTVGFAGVSYWRSTDRLDLIEETARAADRKVDQVLKDDTGRRAYVDARIAELDRRASPVEIIARDVARMEKALENFDLRLTAGREERLADNTKIVDAVNASKTELALLRQEFQQTKALIEGQRPTMRRPSMLMQFGGGIMFAAMRRNAAQNSSNARTAGDEIADSIDEDRNELSRMRDVLRNIRDALESMETLDQDDLDPEDDPEPEQASPKPRDAEVKSTPRGKREYRAATRSKSSRKRRPYRARSGFTRALDRVFGRPYYRGRYWGSFRRHGIFR